MIVLEHQILIIDRNTEHHPHVGANIQISTEEYKQKIIIERKALVYIELGGRGI